jgi:hypothetical protein
MLPADVDAEAHSQLDCPDSLKYKSIALKSLKLIEYFFKNKKLRKFLSFLFKGFSTSKFKMF